MPTPIDDLQPIPPQPEISEGNKVFHEKSYNLYVWMRTKLAPAIEYLVGLIVNFVSAAYTGTSTSSMTLGTGSKTINIQPGLGFVPGNPIRVANTTDPTKFEDGVVVTYNNLTGALSYISQFSPFADTFSNWTISMVPSAQGFIGSILQTVTFTNSTRTLVSCTANTWRDTGLSLTITPQKSNSLIDIDWRIGFTGQDLNIPVRVRLVKGTATVVSNGSAINAGLPSNSESTITFDNLTAVETAGGTTAITYKIQIISGTTQTVAVNGGFSGSASLNTTTYAKVREISQ